MNFISTINTKNKVYKYIALKNKREKKTKRTAQSNSLVKICLSNFTQIF